MEYAIRLDFLVTNNDAEYEAVLAGLKMTKGVMVQKIEVCIDSQLVALQFSGEFKVEGPSMIKYSELLKTFERVRGFQNGKNLP